MTAGASPFPQALRSARAQLSGLRWLIAGNEPGCDEMERAVLDHLEPVWVTRVSDPLAALGELARTAADVVALTAESPDSVADEADALRQLLPSARLLLIQPEAAEPEPDLAAAFDTAVASPITASLLRRALGVEDDPTPPAPESAEPQAPSASPASATETAGATPRAASTNGRHADESPTAPPATPAQPDDAEPRGASLRRRSEIAPNQLDQFGRLRGPEPAPHRADAAAPAIDAPSPLDGPDGDGHHGEPAAIADTPDAADDVGDIDLINSVLAGRGVRDLALDVVRSRSSLPGVFLADAAAGVPAGHIYERVTFKGRDFGVLCAPNPAPGSAGSEPGGPSPGAPRSPRSGELPDATSEGSAARDELAGWAQWIGHWLALDEQMALLKDMSMRDALTGVWNRRYFDRFLRRILDWAGRERSQVTLLVFDIDDFKVYNDRYGHAAGDEILKECSKLMLSVVREHDVVARVGGDEFAVIFWDADPHPRNPRNPRSPNARHPDDVVAAARRFQQAILKHNFPKLLSEAPGTLTISGGLASFPWDGRTPEELLDKADQMALQSKRQGKNAIMFGPGAERAFQMKRE